MNYEIIGDEKALTLPNGDKIRAYATQCELEFWAEIQKLRSLLNKAGDDLCWIEDPKTARALPAKEFMESCRRYHAQLVEERGELNAGQMTIAQLETRAELEAKLGDLDKS